MALRGNATTHEKSEVLSSLQANRFTATVSWTLAEEMGPLGQRQRASFSQDSVNLIAAQVLFLPQFL